ncbi:hypothetical protein CTI14_72565, partial [Methylobacterium radiotolerans]
MVRDPVGIVGALRLDGLDQADETLRTMPFTRTSLVVRDPVGIVGALRLDGLDQADETLRTMPFTRT